MPAVSKDSDREALVATGCPFDRRLPRTGGGTTTEALLPGPPWLVALRIDAICTDGRDVYDAIT